MKDKIILTKVSDSKSTELENNIAIYESDNGFTFVIRYRDNNKVENNIDIRITNT